jgi:alkylation response protein AidB-like acyl-CoA dehydrogenase
MDLDWSPEQKAFRARVRKALAEKLPSDWAERTGYDTGSEATVEFSRSFAPYLASQGLLVPHWPKEYGGEDAGAFLHWIMNEEMWAVGEPRSYQYMNVNWVGPAFMKYGTDDQKAFHLDRIREGSIYYCQGFSEPNAGSDLASLQCRAERTSAGYVINGSKIWTSAASFANFCILLVRTGGPGRSGISVLIVPMEAPGVIVRKIPSLQGAQALHEVFFQDVEVPHGALLGGENEGWSVIGNILANERIGSPRYALTRNGLHRAVALLEAEGRYGPDARLRSARCEAALDAAMLHAYGVIERRELKLPPDASTNVARLAAIHADRMVNDFLVDFVPEALVGTDQPIIAAAFKRTAAIGIASGAAEIQMNLIARDLLELPR